MAEEQLVLLITERLEFQKFYHFFQLNQRTIHKVVFKRSKLPTAIRELRNLESRQSFDLLLKQCTIKSGKSRAHAHSNIPTQNNLHLG